MFSIALLKHTTFWKLALLIIRQNTKIKNPLCHVLLTRLMSAPNYVHSMNPAEYVSLFVYSDTEAQPVSINLHVLRNYRDNWKSQIYVHLNISPPQTFKLIKQQHVMRSYYQVPKHNSCQRSYMTSI